MEVGKGWIQPDPASHRHLGSTLTRSTQAWKGSGTSPARFPYLDGDQGLFVIDVDEDVIPGREADVICNRSGAALGSQDLGIPEPKNLGIDLRE